jgi:hypothetical protein
VVIPSVKTSTTKGQKPSAATSLNGPQVPKRPLAAPPRTAAITKPIATNRRLE